MEQRKVKSQPALPERRWSSSEGQSLRRTHSMSTDRKEQLPRLQGPRPMSSIPSRPESRASRPGSRASRLPPKPDSRPASRVDSRPASRLDSRPPSRLDSRLEARPVQATQGIMERPKSGTVRPLSSRVFIRRTAVKGWVAKAYPDILDEQDLDIQDDLSDCDSLDSFFDDDFDMQQQGEKLQKLLTCNTLKVESKGRRKDWITGDIALPEFHCPRCRDHWYGLTDFPCDEELARLIREGLWYTGKGDPSQAGKSGRHSARNRRLNSGREFESSSSESLVQLNLKNRRRMAQNSAVQGSFGNGENGIEGETKKKNKKRITFKLDNVDDRNLDGDVYDNDGSPGRGKKGHGAASSQSHSADGLDGGEYSDIGGLQRKSEDRVGDGDSRRMSHRDNEDGGSLIDVSGSRKEGRGVNGHNRRGRLESGSGSLDESDPASRGSRNRNSGGRDRHGFLDTGGDESAGGGSGGSRFRGRAGARDRGLTGGDDNDELRVRLDGRDGQGTSSRDRFGIGLEQSGSRSMLTASEDHQSLGGEREDGRGGYGKGTNSDDGSGLLLSRRGSLNSSSQVSKSGEGRLGREDRGKKVRKAVGYMRAVSPSGSEWGDPTHGRLYISSTATSSRVGSTVNLHKDQEDKGDEEEHGFTLPPLIPPVKNNKPLIDLVGGFQVTRAWTFSYHS